jgi:hypothetical protein
MPAYHRLILAALFVIAIWFSWKVLLRQTARLLLNKWALEGPRVQPLAFVRRLRELVFNNPFTAMNMLWSDGRDAFVKHVWKEAGEVARRAREPGNLSDDGLAVERRHLQDGRALAVITMPPPLRKGEPHLVAVVLPADDSLRNDLHRARELAEIFVLNRGGGGDTYRDTDLCGWRASGRELTYNVGAPRDVYGFVKAVDAKLRELNR